MSLCLSLFLHISEQQCSYVSHAKEKTYRVAFTNMLTKMCVKLHVETPCLPFLDDEVVICFKAKRRAKHIRWLICQGLG